MPRPDACDLDVDCEEPPIVLSDELSGLDPATTYRYRLGDGSRTARARARPRWAAKKDLHHPHHAPKSPTSRSCPNADVRAAQHAAYLGDLPRHRAGQQPRQGQPERLLALGADGRISFTRLSADGEQDALVTCSAAPRGRQRQRVNTFLAQRSRERLAARRAPPRRPQQQYGGGGLAYFLNACDALISTPSSSPPRATPLTATPSPTARDLCACAGGHAGRPEAPDVQRFRMRKSLSTSAMTARTSSTSSATSDQL